jgi:hypothetical protein
VIRAPKKPVAVYEQTAPAKRLLDFALGSPAFPHGIVSVGVHVVDMEDMFGRWIKNDDIGVIAWQQLTFGV